MRPLLPKIGWMLAGVLALFTVSALAGVVSGGPLDPPGAPGSTMLRLSELPPSWHQILASNNGVGNGCNSTRFQCVLSDQAVLDKETGLVWQRTVAADSTNILAYQLCETIELGGRYGWRLPTIQEIRTLSDTSADHLPDGHPFVGVLTPSDDFFWTSTFFPSGGTGSTPAVVLNFDAPGVWLVKAAETESLRRWCVRGGSEWDSRS